MNEKSRKSPPASNPWPRNSIFLSWCWPSSAGNAQGKPVVSDLRDSGSIEQDADQIIMIHRPYMYKPDKHDPTEAQWIIGKNRFGRLGRIQFRWTAELTKYEEEQNYPVTNK